MSRLRPTLLFAALGAFAVLAVSLEGARWRAAELRVRAAGGRLDLTREKSGEVRALRGMDQRVASAARPAQDVIAQVNRALLEVGIRTDSLTALEPTADDAVDDGGRGGLYRRQSVSATMEGLQPRQIGEFLAEWRRAQPLWVPSRIELSHARGPASAEGLYALRMEMTSIHLADNGPEEQR